MRNKLSTFFYITLFILLFLNQTGWTQNNLPTLQPTSTQPKNLKVSIKLTKRQYFINEPILADITVKNVSYNQNSIRFKMNNNKFEHFDLTLLDENDHKIDFTIKYLTWKHRSIYNSEKISINDNNRTIELNVGESFTTTINLKDWFSLNKPGFFFIDGDFHPNFNLDNGEYFFKIHSASFHINPDYQTEKQLNSIVEEDHSQYSGNGFFPPDEVVKKFITSQQDKNWQGYLSCVKTDEFLKNSYMTTEIFERFRDARSDERKIILEDFKNFLLKSIDYDIDKYQIFSTKKYADSAEVKVKMHIKASSQKYIEKINPMTGQMEVSWQTNKIKDYYQNQVVYFKLKKYNNKWKIVEKIVSLHKSYDFDENMEDSPFNDSKKPIRIDNVLFDQGNYFLTATAGKTLDFVASIMKKQSDYKIEIRGYTDNVGGSIQNMNLSKSRAISVYNYLINKGIKKNRIMIKWFGKAHPLTDNSSESKKHLNRRVEIIIIER